MKNFIKKLSTIALFGFIISSPVFSKYLPSAPVCTVGAGIDSNATRNIKIIGAEGVLVQVCGTGDGCMCNSWDQKTGGKMPLNPVPKNADGTYTLLSENGYTRYYLADASGKQIEETVQLSNNFKNATTWTLVTRTIINNRIA